MSKQKYQADTFAADGNGTTLALYGSKNEITVYFGAGVTFGSGTLTLMVSPDGGTTWVSTGTTYTSATASTKHATVLTVFGTHVRWALTGSTTPTLNVAMKAEQVSANDAIDTTITANGSSSTFMLPRDVATAALILTGTFDSASVTLQASPDGGTTWFKVTGALTANGYTALSAQTDLMFKFVTASIATLAALTARVYH